MEVGFRKSDYGGTFVDDIMHETYYRDAYADFGEVGLNEKQFDLVME